MLKALCIWLRLCTSISGPATIIDGDTLIIDSYHIRLYGIDAEEMNEPSGPRARQALIGLIRGHIVVCKLSGDISYNRYVATCLVNGNDVAELMVVSGYALDCARYSYGKYLRFEPLGIRLILRQKPYC